MVLSIEAVPRPAHRYRLPTLLQDIRLLDLLELSGTTQETARMACLSQPTVSRRTRAVAQDFSLVPNRRRLVGCCYGTNPAIQLLRLSCRAHRLMAGVARLGSDVILQPLLAGCGWLLPAPPRFRLVEGWLELVRQGVLDGALLSGLEFEGEGPPAGQGLELLPLGELPLGLATGWGGAAAIQPTTPAVLTPNRTVAKGLQRALEERGLTVKTAGNTCQSPAQWLLRLESTALAMALPELAPAHWWAPLRRFPLPTPLRVPLWLVVPEGWRQQAVLVHTAEQLRCHPALDAPQAPNPAAPNARRASRGSG
ncbi:hypothetical protein KBY76_00385 [Synechococcus sp. GreenBA-s]|nr:hypothetical protein [Synechococcus sp. GreenBA-s]